MTKLDLIDNHPEIFMKQLDIHLTEQELEQLRIISIGNKKLWGSRSPRLNFILQDKKFLNGKRGQQYY